SAYPVVPVPTIKEILALMKVTEELLPRITCPVLGIVSRDDHVVPPENTSYYLGRVASAETEILWLENSYHVATLDNDRELIVQRTNDFFKRRVGNQR